MIRFPNWSDCVRDELPLFKLSRATCEEVPYAAAIVRTAGQNVDGERDQQHARDKEKRHVTHRPLAAANAVASSFLGLSITCSQSRYATTTARKK